MADLIAEANRRIEELEAELEELRNFIAVAGRLSGGNHVAPLPVKRPRPPAASTHNKADFVSSSPKQIVAGLFDILSATDQFLDRDALIERLAERDIIVPGIYANKNLGTILWRNQRLFQHERGTGYRWTGEPLVEPKNA